MIETITVYPVMLPTTKPSNIHKGTKELVFAPKSVLGHKSWIPQYLYFTSDEMIRVGDYYYNQHESHEGKIYKYSSTDSILYDGINKRIVASTDESLTRELKEDNEEGMFGGYYYMEGSEVIYITKEDFADKFPSQIEVSFVKGYVKVNGKIDSVQLESYTDCPNCEMCDESVMNRDCGICKGGGFNYIKTSKNDKVIVISENKDVIGKYIIVKDLQFSDFMKDDNRNIQLFDSKDEALTTCGMYEFPNVLILKVECDFIEDDGFVSMHDKLNKK